jgi:hypothetical protein
MGSWYSAIYHPVHWKYFHPGAVRYADVKVMIQGYPQNKNHRNTNVTKSRFQFQCYRAVPEAQSLHYLPLRHMTTKVHLTHS